MDGLLEMGASLLGCRKFTVWEKAPEPLPASDWKYLGDRNPLPLRLNANTNGGRGHIGYMFYENDHDWI